VYLLRRRETMIVSFTYVRAAFIFLVKKRVQYRRLNVVATSSYRRAFVSQAQAVRYSCSYISHTV